jgi:hypothetical protein
MLRRSAGYILLLLALLAALPMILLLTFLASGANIGSQGHFHVLPVVLEISLTAALLMGSFRMLMQGRSVAQRTDR